ncbi:MAG: hypothetical protein HKO80_02450 [Flavobacteriaceae bacterium]|nr:hypothetical protein [Flavobacteriaceae bacterium]
MTSDLKSFGIKLLLFSLVLFGIHSYLMFQFYDGDLQIKIWMIYIFNAVLVLAVYGILSYQTQKGSKKIFYTFLALTIAKMFLAILFLLPLFIKKPEHSQLEVINFFIPYFLFLTFEILSINKFLQKL